MNKDEKNIGKIDNVTHHRLSESLWVDESQVIEIEDFDTVSIASYAKSSEQQKRWPTPVQKVSPSPSSKTFYIRRMIQREYANLFLTDWLHEHLRGENDCPEVAEEWGDYGNLQIVAGKEEYRKSITEADALEVWFDNSPMWRRFLFRFLSVMIVFLVLHSVGFFLTVGYIDDYSHDPFVCETHSCMKISRWLNASVNPNVDPCDNFYQFVCGNYNKDIRQSEDTFDEEYGLFILFKSLRSDIQQRLVYGEIFRNTSDSHIFHQVRLVFQSCLNYTARDEIGVSDFVQTMNDIGLHPDNSSTNVNNLAFEVWRYTGQLGILVLKLFVNPYDGLRKYDASYYDESYHKHVMKKDLGSYIFAFQEIAALMKITKYSAEELARAFQQMLDGIGKAKTSVTLLDKDISLWPKDREPFLCDDFLHKLDEDAPDMGTINEDNYFLNQVVAKKTNREGKFRYAKFICNGGLNKILNDNKDINYPNVDATLSYKAYWIMWMFYYYYGTLNPALKIRMENGGVFPTAAYAPRGAECLRAIRNNLPHIIHERLMKTYRISDDDMAKTERMYHYTKKILESWFNHEEREKTFGVDTLKLYREAIKYGFQLKNYRFSLAELEKLGYGESAKKIKKTNFIKNMLILRQILSDNEIKKWRMEEGFFLPVAYPNFKYIIKELVTAEVQMRPQLFHTSLMPALLYTNLYSTKDLLPLYYGGIRAYFVTDIIYRWVYYVRDRIDVKLDPIDLHSCTVINVNEKDRLSVTDVNSHRANYFPYHIIFDVLMETFHLEREFKIDRGQFFYRKLFAYEEYSEDQLVFMKMIRHQCASLISDSDMNEMLTGLSNSVAFQNAWKCPVNSSMNHPQRCYRGRTELSAGIGSLRLQIERKLKPHTKNLTNFHNALAMIFYKDEDKNI